MAIQHNVQDVEKAILIVRSAVASGMAWDELDELIAAEKGRGNPIAALIDSTQLETNEMTLRLLTPPSYDEDGESVHGKPIKVTVDISESAHANISIMFSNKKQAISKTERTLAASEKVLQDAERKFVKEMEKLALNQTRVQVQRKVLWFEKFNWFVTSEGFLVISGRDAQQNELIVKKFLRKSHGDIYVHADLHGASTCVVRSPRPGVEIPPESLRQAGAMTVCQSSAWNAKIITSAWWVRAEQVSKTAPTGEYLSTGSFMIRGKKNFLPPCRLELMFGILFKLDETQESFDNRRIEWRVQQEMVDENNDDGSDFSSSSDDEGDNLEGEDEDGDALPHEKQQQRQEEQEVEDQSILPQKKPPTQEEQQIGDEDALLQKKKPGRDEHIVVSAKGVPKKQRQEKPRAATTQATSSTTKKDNESKRGKKGKMKKMKKKYADQTEQDRRIAMIALGHQIEGDDDAPQENPGGHDGNTTATRAPTETAAALADAGGVPFPERPPKAVSNKQEEQVVEDTELNLKGFTMSPQPDDVLLYALPFCAPPQAAINAKYRVKLTPGSQKRGKAGKQALELFLKMQQGSKVEKDLLRQVPENEITMAMHGQVKLSAPGINNTSKQAKAAKNAKRIKKPRK